jgi:N-acyl-D-aspartate/D-glutamate deacylase
VKAAVGAHAEVHVYFKHDPEAPALAQRLLQSVGPVTTGVAGTVAVRRGGGGGFSGRKR